jgi:hypothetical protein
MKNPLVTQDLSTVTSNTHPAMRIIPILFLSAIVSIASAAEWQILFDGSSLDGWKAAEENPESVRIEDGVLVLNGKRCHLFWMGEDGKASFKNFEAEVVFQTEEKANAGLFFHTEWQAAGWPGKGLECQMNATHGDWRKTGSIYAIKDVKEPGHADGKWVTMKLRVEGDVVKVWIDGKLHNEWTQTAEHTLKKKRLDSGTFAFQAHDPDSVVRVKSFKVKALP